MNTTPCQYCQWPLLPEYIFCPHCGNRVAPFYISLASQIGTYAVSLLLPPFGLVPALRYLRQKESSAKRVGAFALLLTIVSTAITIWVSLGIFSTITSQLQVQSQIQQYQNLGL